MFPRTIRQNKKIKQLFYSQLEINNAKKQKTMSDEDIKKMNANIKKGKLGEKKSRRALKLFLPRDCIIMNDVILEITPNYFNQFDHLILSPKGIYIVDTKNWDFEWELPNNNSEWTSQKANERNPNTQKVYHKKNFIFWVEDNFEEYDKITPFVNSKIILLGKVNKNYGDEDTVIKPKHIADKIKVFAAKRNIPQDTLIRLANCISNASPLNHWEWIFNHYEIKDERKIFVDASFNETLKIKSIYKDKGFKVTDIKKYGANKHYFEVTNHIELLEDNIKLVKRLQNMQIRRTKKHRLLKQGH
jgi:hypothetical protein